MKSVSLVSLKDQAAAALRREIYAGELPDGAELRQEDIAAQLGISRLPVREAMQQLQNEGLLERLPNRHVRVVGVTAARLRQSFAVLAAMECELFALADTALREKGLPDPACDAEFHLAAAEVLDNPTLYQRFFTQRQGLLDAAQALGAAEPAALIERNRAIAEAFTVGKDTAPFKSQNMALNSFVTRDGLEMGRAQVVQAQAAGVEPDVRMNPILLKPSSDVGSQVIVNGEVRGDMPAKEYFRRKKSLIPDILRAYDSLADEFDIIVIEGAGSPAEINLKADDIVNMGLAKLVDAPVLLAGDIDRGGVFAQLYGTVALLEPDERARICGLIINKFRGDVEILRPGLAMLEKKTQLSVLGVVPYLRVDIEDEDSLAPRLQSKSAVKPLDAAVLRLPHISNFTDFMPLEQHPLLGVRYVQSVRELGAPDLVILPGTKNTVNDLLWLRQSGLEAAVLKLAAGGTPVLGVCGGYQLLGETLDDSQGTESGHPQTLRGLGLLPTRTVFTAEKRRAQVTATAAAPFAGAALTGYEIHTGRTAVNGAPFCRYADGTPEGCVQNAVFGTYLHGLFDSGELTEQLAAYLCRRKGIAPETAAPLAMADYRTQQLDLLADGVRSALDMDAVYAAMGLHNPRGGKK